MGDDDDQAIDVTRHEATDPVHRTVEVFGIEAPEPLVEEEAVEAAASARDHLGERERERERGEEGLAARERVRGPVGGAGVHVEDVERIIVAEAVGTVRQLFEVDAAQIRERGSLLFEQVREEPRRLEVGREPSRDVPRSGRDDQTSLEIRTRSEGLLDRSHAFGRGGRGRGGIGDHAGDVHVRREVERRELGGDGFRRRMGLRGRSVPGLRGLG